MDEVDEVPKHDATAGQMKDASQPVPSLDMVQYRAITLDQVITNL